MLFLKLAVSFTPYQRNINSNLPMIFQTLIQDCDGKEWSFEGDVIGRGMYDDEGEKTGFCIEGFNIVDILLTTDEEKILEDVENINVMPDRFSEREIKDLCYEAQCKFLEDWQDVQGCAHDLLNEAN